MASRRTQGRTELAGTLVGINRILGQRFLVPHMCRFWNMVRVIMYPDGGEIAQEANEPKRPARTESLLPTGVCSLEYSIIGRISKAFRLSKQESFLRS